MNINNLNTPPNPLFLEGEKPFISFSIKLMILRKLLISYCYFNLTKLVLFLDFFLEFKHLLHPLLFPRQRGIWLMLCFWNKIIKYSIKSKQNCNYMLSPAGGGLRGWIKSFRLREYRINTSKRNCNYMLSPAGGGLRGWIKSFHSRENGINTSGILAYNHKHIKKVLRSALLVQEIIVSIIILFPFNSFAQTTTFTLDDCIKYAKKNSPEGKSAKFSYKSKIKVYEANEANYLPQLMLYGSAPGLIRQINPITQPDGSILYQSQSQLSASGNISLTQKIAEFGSELSISSGLSRYDILDNQGYSIWGTTPFQLSYSQPIFKYNSMKWDRRIQNLRFEKSDDEFSTAMENLAINITQKFFDYYVAKMNVQNSEQNVQVNDTLYTISKGRFGVGKIAENDLLQNELGLLNAKNEFEAAKLELKRSDEDLKIALGYPVTSNIEVIPPDIIKELYIDATIAVNQAIVNNPTMIDYDIQKLQADMNLAQTQSNNNLNADLIASFGYNQSATLLGDSYKNLLDQQRVDITLQIPLFTWGKGSADIENAEYYLKATEISIELQKKLFELDVKYQSQKLMQLINQVQLTAKADTIAAKRFDVTKNRYLVGKIDMNSFFVAQNEKDSAFRNYIQILKSFWISYFTIRKLTLYDFVQNKKIIHELE
jgi:outer membrane protein TolC